MYKANIYCLHLTDAGSLLSKKGASRLISQTGYELLRVKLQEYADLSFSSEELQQKLIKGPHGKPSLSGCPQVHFNLSHSADRIALILAPIPVGIDIQKKQDMNLSAIARRIYDEAEYAAFLESENQNDHFFRSWVEKESFVKWTGEGITHSLKSLPDRGWIRHIDAAPDFACAICAQEEMELQIQYLQE